MWPLVLQHQSPYPSQKPRLASAHLVPISAPRSGPILATATTTQQKHAPTSAAVPRHRFQRNALLSILLRSKRVWQTHSPYLSQPHLPQLANVLW
jgi:hypothetical protein